MKNKKKISQFRSVKEGFIEELAKSKKSQKLYLKVAFEDYKKDGDLAAFLLALRTLTLANGGFIELSKKTNLNRQTIYKALSANGNPSFSLVEMVLKTLGMELRIG
jgi:probable addiction module antidote protein